MSEKVRAKSVRFPELGDVEGQVQSLSAFSEKLSTSVPYAEFRYSPFMVTDPAYGPYIRSLQLSWNILAAHAQSFVSYVMASKAATPEKRLRTAASVYHLLNSGSPLVPRDYFHQETMPQAALDWIDAIRADR